MAEEGNIGWTKKKNRGWQRRSRLAQALAGHGAHVREVLGAPLTLMLKIASRLPWPRM